VKVERALALARAARQQERRAADRDRLRALVLAAHNATRRCQRVAHRTGQPLDLRALSAALESAATAVSRARNRAVLDARAETEEREP